MDDRSKITELLQKMRGGDSAASEELIEAVYAELRRLAGHYMKAERGGHTLQPTALVHEVYAKLFSAEPVDWQSRSHFFAVAARQMRRYLVDHARQRNREKRGGGAISVELDEQRAVGGEAIREDVLAVNEALDELERQDPRAAQVVELKFFGGLTDQEAAEAIGISFAAFRRDWEFARAWLFHRMSGGSATESR